MAVAKGQNTQEQLWQRSLDSLRLADRLGWLNASVLAYAFWPKAPSRRKYAERLLATLVKRGWFKPHKMPFRQPSCYTATKTGQRQWALGEYAQPSDMKIKLPGATYQHDTRAASVLLYLAGGDLAQVIFDHEISTPEGRKRPDGILLDTENLQKGWWLEVENARKTGPNMRRQVADMIEITMAAGQGGHWLNTPIGAVSPLSCVRLIVPENYNMDAFRQRVQKQLNFDDKGEYATFGFVRETKDGFDIHHHETISQRDEEGNEVC